MSLEFWLGLLLSIPISIGTAVVSPWFGRKLEAWSDLFAKRRYSKNISEYHRIRRIKEASSLIEVMLSGLSVLVVNACALIICTVTMSMTLSMLFNQIALDKIGKTVIASFGFINVFGFLVTSFLLTRQYQRIVRTLTLVKKFQFYQCSVIEKYGATAALPLEEKSASNAQKIEKAQ